MSGGVEAVAGARVTVDFTQPAPVAADLRAMRIAASVTSSAGVTVMFVGGLALTVLFEPKGSVAGWTWRGWGLFVVEVGEA